MIFNVFYYILINLKSKSGIYNEILMPSYFSIIFSQPLLFSIKLKKKIQADSNILAATEAGQGNCFPYFIYLFILSLYLSS